MGGGQQSSSGGSTDWSSNLSQGTGGYSQPSSFNWTTFGKGLENTGAAYAQGAYSSPQSPQISYRALSLPMDVEQNYLIPTSSNTSDMSTILQRLLGSYQA